MNGTTHKLTNTTKQHKTQPQKRKTINTRNHSQQQNTNTKNKYTPKQT